jgi:hypothetical protein
MSNNASGGGGIFGSLRALDVYPKLSEEYKVRTASGAASKKKFFKYEMLKFFKVSIAAILIMAMLFISELSFYLTAHKTEHLVVDLTMEDKIQINFDFSFDRVPCSCKKLIFYVKMA